MSVPSTVLWVALARFLAAAWPNVGRFLAYDLDPARAGVVIPYVSLRDLSASVIRSNHNIVDELDHVNRAATSSHLASQQESNTDFVHCSLGDILLGNFGLPGDDGCNFN